MSPAFRDTQASYLAAKLSWLIHSEAFDQPNMRSLDAARMLQAGSVSVIDVSIANDIVKNMVTADLLVHRIKQLQCTGHVLLGGMSARIYPGDEKFGRQIPRLGGRKI